MGHLVENVVASHLHSLAVASGTRPFHWRDGRQEVDFVLDEGGEPAAFEVGLSGR